MGYLLAVNISMTQLVILNGPSGDLIPNQDLETWVINGNFLRRRWDHVVSFELDRLRLIREHGVTSIWTRPQYCRGGEHPVLCTEFYDSGNAAIWAAAQRDQHIIIGGADAWLGGEQWSVSREIYAMGDKKHNIGAKWSSKFLKWSRNYPDHRFEFVWHQDHEFFTTISLDSLNNIVRSELSTRQ